MSRLCGSDEMQTKLWKRLSCINLQKEGWALGKDFWILLNLHKLHSNWKDSKSTWESTYTNHKEFTRSNSEKFSPFYPRPKSIMWWLLCMVATQHAITSRDDLEWEKKKQGCWRTLLSSLNLGSWRTLLFMVSLLGYGESMSIWINNELLKERKTP